MLAKPSITEILSYTQQIGAADLLAFAGGQIPVVPPPGDGKLVWPISCFLVYNFGTVDFRTKPVLTLVYHADMTPVFLADLAFLVGSGSSQWAAVPAQTNLAFPSPTSSAVNEGLDLNLVSGAFALGGVGTASVTAGGTGYAIGDTGTISTGGANATYRVLTVSGLGAVLTFAITAPGSGYTAGAGQATATGGAQPGVGINFTVDVLTLVNGDGSLKVTTLYQVIDVP